MKYLSIKEVSKLWGISERRIRQLCIENRVPGAFQTGSIWNIPQDAQKPNDARVDSSAGAKTILITGASRGIGKATAEKFLEEGYVVYGTYFESEANIVDLQSKFGKDRFIACGPYDFTKISEVNKLCDKLVGIDFDAVFFNAGIFSENDDFLMFNINEFNSVMNCNFYSPLIIAITLQKFIKNNGAIVLMSSNDAYSGAYGSMSYSISKAAVISLMKCLSVNFGRRRIRVNSVAPGAIDTDMNTPEQVIEAPKLTPIERIAKPYEVAEVVYFLCSSASSFINGENITIDGGYSNVSSLLKQEISRNRKFAGYDFLIGSMKNLGKGDTVLCLDTTPEYGWIDNKNEVEFIDSCIEAQNNGAQISRIILCNDNKLDNILSNKLINKYINSSNKDYLNCVVKTETIKRLCPKSFSKIGKGFNVYQYKNGKRLAFIDSFSGEDAVGYLTDNEIVINSLVEAFNDFKAKINANKIKKEKL